MDESRGGMFFYFLILGKNSLIEYDLLVSTFIPQDPNTKILDDFVFQGEGSYDDLPEDDLENLLLLTMSKL